MGTRKNRLNEAVLTCTHNLCFEQKMKIVKKFQLKIVIFTDVKNRCMLHRHVFVMFCSSLGREHFFQNMFLRCYTFILKLMCFYIMTLTLFNAQIHPEGDVLWILVEPGKAVP